MSNQRIFEAKVANPKLWREIKNRWDKSAELATDDRPDYAWSTKQAEKEFAKAIGIELEGVNKKDEFRKFKEFKKKQELFSKANDNRETLLDPIMDKLAVYMDLHFGGHSFMDELCK